jgi:D-amino peptidase
VTGTILISADMEGATGVARPEDVTPASPYFARARECWVADLNAVVAGLFAHGAGEVVVTDAHGNASNLEQSLIDPRAGLIRGTPRRFGMLEGIDSGVDGVVFLAYHGAPGSGGVLSHAYMAAGIHAIHVGGEPAGEGTINAHLAAAFGVPVLLVTGDRAACAEASRYAPEAELVQTKEAISRFSARLRPVEAVRRDLAAAAERAMKRLSASPPVVPDPGRELTAEIEFSSENTALVATAIPGVRSTGSRTVCFAAADVPAWYRCLGAIWTLARSSREARYG